MTLIDTIFLAQYSSFSEAFVVGGLSSIVAFFVIKGVSRLFPGNNPPDSNEDTETIHGDTKPIVGKSNNSNFEESYILEELKEKCNPKNFMEPYDYGKVNKANDLYTQLLNCTLSDKEKISILLQEAEAQLGVRISTKKIFEELCSACNPARFSDPNCYDAEKIRVANNLYQRILQHKDDYSVLESIREEAKSYGFTVKAFRVGQIVVCLKNEDQLKISEITQDKEYICVKSGTTTFYGRFRETELADFDEYWANH